MELATGGELASVGLHQMGSVGSFSLRLACGVARELNGVPLENLEMGSDGFL